MVCLCMPVVDAQNGMRHCKGVGLKPEAENKTQQQIGFQWWGSQKNSRRRKDGELGVL